MGNTIYNQVNALDLNYHKSTVGQKVPYCFAPKHGRIKHWGYEEPLYFYYYSRKLKRAICLENLIEIAMYASPRNLDLSQCAVSFGEEGNFLQVAISPSGLHGDVSSVPHRLAVGLVPFAQEDMLRFSKEYAKFFKYREISSKKEAVADYLFYCGLFECSGTVRIQDLAFLYRPNKPAVPLISSDCNDF